MSDGGGHVNDEALIRRLLTTPATWAVVGLSANRTRTAYGVAAWSGVRRLIVAGGETSGAVVQALGVRQLRIGAAICPGVPWTQAEGASFNPPLDAPLHLALKSGNFGGADFFDQALRA